jgi:tRNA nucleotidyltransferase/poly(A) polymerase
MRRDFTVNAMFFDPVSQAYIDYAGGIPDIAAKRIRTVGSPDDRFKEDHLRMLRAVRFSQSLGFTLEKDTAARIQKNAPSIERISAERIQGELFRILLESAEPGSAILLLHRLGLMRQILPLTSRSHAASQLKRTAGILNALARQPLEVLLTALLLRTGMPAGRAATAGHRHSIHKKTRRELQSLRVSKAIEQHVLQSQSLYWELAQVRKHIPRERLPDLLTPHADTVFAILSVGLPARAVSLSETRATVRNRMKMRPIGGSDLKKSGLVAGPAMGRAIKEALILQCEGLKKREILAKLKLS